MGRLLTALLTMALASPTAGWAADAKAMASAQYEQGVQAFRGKRFKVALGHFEKAFKLDSSPVLLYNLARCYEELGRYDQAEEHYQLYLARSPKAEDRVRVEERVRVLRLERRRQSERAAALAAEREAAAKAEAQAKAAADASDQGEADRLTQTVAPAGGGEHLAWWGYGLVGLGTAGLAYGLISGLDATDTADQIGDTNDPARKSSLERDATAAQDRANLAYGIGGALVAGGVGLLVWQALGDDGAAVAVTPTPSGGAFVLGGRF